jgi:heme A synthase
LWRQIEFVEQASGMNTQTTVHIRTRAAIHRLVALAVVLLPVVLAACSGDNGGGGGAGGY